MALQDNILKVIADEIKNDPYKLGYAGKTNKEIIDLLNNPYQKEVITTVTYPARINQIMLGIANMSNVINEADIISAKNKIAEIKII